MTILSRKYVRGLLGYRLDSHPREPAAGRIPFVPCELSPNSRPGRLVFPTITGRATNTC